MSDSKPNKAVQQFAGLDCCQMRCKWMEREHEVVADIAWNLSLLLSYRPSFVEKALQDLWDRLPSIVALQTDNLPQLEVLHRKRAISLASAALKMVSKDTATSPAVSSLDSTAVASGAAGTAIRDDITVEADEAEVYTMVLNNMAALQQFHQKRAQVLSSELKDRQSCCGWL